MEKKVTEGEKTLKIPWGQSLLLESCKIYMHTAWENPAALRIGHGLQGLGEEGACLIHNHSDTAQNTCTPGLGLKRN